MKDIIIIPTYNERENVKWLIPAIFKLLPEIFIMIVDDNSPDGTAKEIEILKNQYNKLSLFMRDKKEGLGAAYKHALTECKSDSSIRTIITMDADSSHNPVYLEKMLKESQKNDLVIGSRYVSGGNIENWSWSRKLLSHWGNIYARIFTGLPIFDLTSGFVAFRASLLQSIDLETIRSSGYAYQIHFKYECLSHGATFTEIPIIFKEREHGQSKITFSIILEGILTPLWLRLRKLWVFFF